MNKIITINNVKDVIIPLRGEDVILAADVAKLYGVETKVINQAVKNNPDKFPEGFVLIPDNKELAHLRSKFSTTNISSKTRTVPKAFTERGLYMLATILKSPVATRTTLAIVNTFAQVREVRRQILAMHEMEEKMSERGYTEEEIADILK